jgi:hypothetical protein
MLFVSNRVRLRLFAARDPSPDAGSITKGGALTCAARPKWASSENRTCHTLLYLGKALVLHTLPLNMSI